MTGAVITSNVVTLSLTGEINAANANGVKQQLTKAVESLREEVLLVDMAEVEFLDSAGLMALVTTLRLAQNLDRRMSLCSISPSIMILFELTQLDRVFEIFKNRHAFYASL